MAVSASGAGSAGGSVSDYYSQAAEYYNQKEQTVGHWTGRGLEFVGLKEGQDITKEAIDNLAKGYSVNGTEALTYNAGRENHRGPLDITYSPDKSVSLVREFMPELRDTIDKAVEAAVYKNIQNIENTEIAIRETRGQETTRVQSDNIIAAVYRHDVSHAQNPDPQLHYHAVVMNLVHTVRPDKQGFEFKALENSDIFKNQTLNSRAFTNDLAKNLIDAGIAIEITKNGFRIAGITDEMSALFSKRSAEMARAYDALKEKYPNETDAALKERAALQTRQAKDLNKVTSASNIDNWKTEAKDAGFDISKSVTEAQEKARSSGKMVEGSLDMSAPEALKAAIKDLTEKESVVSRNELFSKALEYSVGNATLENFRIAEKSLIKDNSLIEKNGNYTTPEIVEAQKSVESAMKNGIGAVSSIAKNDEQIKGAVKAYEVENPDISLTREQLVAVNNIVKSNDRYQAVQGVAGAGKTSMLDVVNKVAKQNGFEIVAISHQGKAADEMSASLNRSVESMTIESFKNNFNLKSNHIVVNDEASMTSLKDMNAIKDKIEAAGSRLINVGDIKQIQSIGAGKIFQESQKIQFGLTVSQLKESMRQTDPAYRSVIKSFNDMHIDKAFDRMEKDGKLTETKGLHAETLDAYRSLSYAGKTQIVTNTNADKNYYNKEIHNERVEKGQVTNVQTFTVKENKNLSPTEMRNAANYQAGDFIFLKKDAGGVGKAGAEFKVTEIDKANNSLKVENVKSSTYQSSSFSPYIDNMKDRTSVKETVKAAGSTLIHSTSISDINQRGNYMYAAGTVVTRTTVNIDLKDQDLVDKIGGVSKESTREFGVGDAIKITKNDKKYDVKNGQFGAIKDINKDNITVKIGSGKNAFERTLNMKEYNHVDHGYASTINGFQGGKSDNVVASLKSNISTQNSTYVAITRGVNDYKVVTDNKEVLRENSKQEQIKTSASDMLSRSDVREAQRQVQRAQVVRQAQQSVKGGGQTAGRQDISQAPTPGGR